MPDDISHVTRKTEKRNLIDYVYAKPDKLLIDHMLETGWTAYEYLTNGFFMGQARRLAEDIGTSFENLVNWICFLIALHDIGKAHPVFQSENMYNSGTDHLINEGMIIPNPLTKGKQIRHEVYSGVIIQEYMKRLLVKVFDGNSMRAELEAKKYGNLESYHHQGKTHENDFLITGYVSEEKWMELIIIPMIDFIYEEFPFTPFRTSPHTDRFFHFVLGLMIFCDRISSANDLTEEPSSEE